MRKLALYYHYRQDGGTRTTVALDGVTILHHFKAGRGYADPALAWYVDVRCEGSRLPVEPAAALQWLRDQGEIVRAALTEFAEGVGPEVEIDIEPLQWKVSGAPRGIRMTLVCMAVGRKNVLRIPAILRGVRDRWDEMLEQLEPSLTEAS